MFNSVVLPFLVAISIWCPGNEAAIPLETYDDVFQSLTSGKEVRLVFDLDACGFNNTGYERLAASIPVEIWQWFDIGGEARIAFSTTFLSPRPSPTPIFIKLTGGLKANDDFTFTFETIDTPSWSTLDKFEFDCPMGSGPRFLEQETFFQAESISAFNEVKQAIMHGNPVTRVANYTNCEVPPPFPTVSGGPVSLFYIPEEGTENEFIKIIDTVLVGNMAEGSAYAINSNHMNVHTNDSIKVNPAMWDTVEWDNDYFRPEGYVCPLGQPGVDMIAAPVSTEYPIFETVEDLFDALKVGYTIQYRVFADQCNSSIVGSSANAVLSDNVDVWQYVYRPGAGIAEIRFSSHHYTESGLLHLEEYTVISNLGEQTFVALVTQIDPATGEITAQEVLECEMGRAALITRTNFDQPEPLTDFEQLESAVLDGEQITFVTSLAECTSGQAESWLGVIVEAPILMREPDGMDQLFTTQHNYATAFSALINNFVFTIFGDGLVLLENAVYEAMGFTEVSGGTQQECSINDGVSGGTRIFLVA